MIKSIMYSLRFMREAERLVWLSLTGIRAAISLLDLVGILTVGFVISSLAVLLSGPEAPSQVFELAGIVFPKVGLEELPLVSAFILSLFLSKAFLSIFLTKRAAFFVAKIEARAAKTIAEASFSGDLAVVRRRSREDVMFAIQSGSPAAFNILLNSVNTLITESTLFVLVCLGFALVDPLTTLAAIIYFGLIALVMQFFIGSKMSRAAKINTRETVMANSAVSDLVSVFRELLVLGKREKYINDLYLSRLAAAESSATTHYLSGMPRYIIESALLLGIALFGLSQALSGDWIKSAGTIAIFLSGGFRLTASLLPLQNALLTIKSVIPVAATAHDILNQALSEPVKPINSREDLIESSRKKGPMSVDFKDVSFTYPDATSPSVSGITFSVEPGSQLALIGPSGAGKSTLADLMCDVISPDSGQIIRMVANPRGGNSRISRGVSYVPQKPGLVSGTILDNIALAENPKEVDRDLVMEALELAHLSATIRELPLGLDTPLGKLQDGLSGGQMQRLGLARALYSKPSLLVMDEATSALDAESEAIIQSALENMKGRVTVVLIAHRLNTVQFADKVLLIEGGKLTDYGTFTELLRKNKSVQELVNLMKIQNS